MPDSPELVRVRREYAAWAADNRIITARTRYISEPVNIGSIPRRRDYLIQLECIYSTFYRLHAILKT